MDPHEALESLLLAMFSADELRRFLRYLPGGDAIAGALPGANASPAAVAHEAVATLVKADYFGEATLWERMIAERPRRAEEINRIRALVIQGVAQAAAGPVAPSPTRPSSVLTILLVSASPAVQDRLRVDQEFRQIIEKLRGSRWRDRLRLVQVPAARFEDVRTALMEHEPHVLHLSGHGEKDGSLVFEPRSDGSHIVQKKSFKRLVRALGSNLRLVVLNVCHSAELARELTPADGCAIGMERGILDTEAIEFSVALYETLAFGRSVQTAFDAALAGLDDDDEVPQLFPPEDQDPDRRRRMVLLSGAST